MSLAKRLQFRVTVDGHVVFHFPTSGRLSLDGEKREIERFGGAVKRRVKVLSEDIVYACY